MINWAVQYVRPKARVIREEVGLCYETLLTTDEQCGRPVAGKNLVTYEQCCATVRYLN